MQNEFRHSPRNLFQHKRRVARAMGALVAMMLAGATAEDCARFVFQQNYRTQISLSWAIEDKAEDGTFAAAIFDILCNG